jgi:hypothetical protein
MGAPGTILGPGNYGGTVIPPGSELRTWPANGAEACNLTMIIAIANGGCLVPLGTPVGGTAPPAAPPAPGSVLPPGPGGPPAGYPGGPAVQNPQDFQPTPPVPPFLMPGMNIPCDDPTQPTCDVNPAINTGWHDVTTGISCLPPKDPSESNCVKD